MTQDLPPDVEARFDEKFNHDDPIGKAIVLISSEEGSVSQRPIQDELKSFLASELTRREKEIVEHCREEYEAGGGSAGMIYLDSLITKDQ